MSVSIHLAKGHVMTQQDTLNPQPTPPPRPARTRLLTILALGLAVVLGTVLILFGASPFRHHATTAPAVASSPSRPAASSSPPATVDAAPSPVVVYSVTSDAPTVSVSYMAAQGEAQADVQTVPFTRTFTVSKPPFYALAAQADSGGTSITCSISVGGVVVDQRTTTGAFGVVACSHTP